MSDVAPMTIEDLAAAILTTEDIRIEPVATPEWPAVDGRLYVKCLSGTEREKYFSSIRKTIGKGKDATVDVELVGSTAQLISRTLCDKHGTLVFSEAHVEALGKKSALALERCMKAATRVNGLSNDAGDEAKKDLPTPVADSSTA